MANILVVFGSTTGNTETVADIITAHLEEAGHEVTRKNVTDVTRNDFESPALILFGCSTWGEETVELQGDFDTFCNNDMDRMPLVGKKVGVFGCGDSSYMWFCGAVDAIADKADALGAKVVVDGLKIDGEPDEARDEILAWATEAATA